MITTVEEAVDWIHGRRPFGTRPGLERVKALLAKVGNPEQAFPSIHVAGTNGKGSTVSYLRALLAETGQNVGTFTSPFIECFNERIQYNQQFISDETIVLLVNHLIPYVEELDKIEQFQGITEFEVLTVMAFLYFAQQQVDIAVIEVGLGGLYDSTNVIDPVVSVITTIGLDHVDILGTTLTEIAAQKAGIIKPKRPVITGNIVPEALHVIGKQAQIQSAPLYQFGKDYQVTYHAPDSEWGEIFSFQFAESQLAKLHTPLLGRHQTENAGVALAAFFVYCQQQGIVPTAKIIRQALKKTYWPARMERISIEPCILLDGAHNEHAMTRLVENLQQDFPQQTIHVLFSAIKTKDLTGMLQQLLTIPHVDILVTTFDFPKAMTLTQEIQQINPKRISLVSLWQLGLAELLEKMNADDILLVTGSLYFVSQVRQLIMAMKETQ